MFSCMSKIRNLRKLQYAYLIYVFNGIIHQFVVNFSFLYVKILSYPFKTFVAINTIFASYSATSATSRPNIEDKLQSTLYSPLKECASIMNVGAAVWRRTVVFLTCNTKSSLSFFSSRCSITLFSRMGEFECCLSRVLYAE